MIYPLRGGGLMRNQKFDEDFKELFFRNPTALLGAVGAMGKFKEMTK